MNGPHEQHEQVDWRSSVAIYHQVAAFLARRIQAGVLQPDDLLPSEKMIQQQFGVGRHTAREAMRLLREQGWAETVPHRGSYVSPREKWPELE
jgi:DNA-binding GntR family transcriptional regulator